jgi:hypothetical protein
MNDVRATRATFANEAEFQAEVMRAALQLGLLAYHPYRSEKSVPGFPDTVIVGSRGVLYRELKMPKGKPSTDQLYWIAALTEAGQNAGIWRPEHWPALILAEMSDLGRLTVRRPEPTQAELRRALRRSGARPRR